MSTKWAISDEQCNEYNIEQRTILSVMHSHSSNHGKNLWLSIVTQTVKDLDAAKEIREIKQILRAVRDQYFETICLNAGVPYDNMLMYVATKEPK